MTADTVGFVSLMQRVKLQADVLVPILRELRATLGKAQADALIYPVLRNSVRHWVSQNYTRESDDPFANWRYNCRKFAELSSDEVEWETIEENANVSNYDVTVCRFADFFREIDEPELGAILTCELDEHIAERSEPVVQMSRPETIMQCGERCKFRYRFQRAK